MIYHGTAKSQDRDKYTSKQVSFFNLIIGDFMSGFQAPNYTQVPNDFFDMINDGMTIAEIKVLSSLLRATLGYHRDEIDITIRQLARITHLDPKSVMSGAVKLEERGLIVRSVGKITTITKWTVIIDEPKLREKIFKTVGNDSYKNRTLPLKRKKEKKNSDAAGSEYETRPNIYKLYEENVGMITPIIAEELKDIEESYPDGWFLDALKESVKMNIRNLKYIRAILEGRKNGKFKREDKPSEYETL
jgi:DnaD/phage-associated family protein